jgi:hypothetical protein
MLRSNKWWLGLLPYTGVILFLIQLPFTLAGDVDDRHAQILQQAVVYVIGWTGIGSGIAHLLFSRQIAGSIGFESNSFQKEVGFANLAFGITGIMAGSQAPDFWLAIIWASSIYRFGCGIGHIHEIATKKNYAINNTGILALNFIVPICLLAAWYAWRPIGMPAG